MKNSGFYICPDNVISKMKEINLELPVANEVLEKLKLVSDGCKIIIKYENIPFFNEVEYYSSILALLKELNKNNKKYNIELDVNNRKLFSDSKILENNFDNLNITITNETDKYTLEEYKQNDERLDELIKDIKDLELSPLERYVYIYSIIIGLKEFKKEEKGLDRRLSRSLKYILDSDYLVCTGFSRLCKVLSNKVNIGNFNYMYTVYEDEPEGVVDKGSNVIATCYHWKNILKLDDGKYGVHGIFLSDPTQDNGLNVNNFNHILMTFDKNKRSDVPQSLSNSDLFLDFHNKDEFYKKIGYAIKNNYKNDEDVNVKIIKLFNDMMEIFHEIDYPKYIYFKQKYPELSFPEDLEDESYITNPNIEKEFVKMLEEYYDYVIENVNKPVEFDVIAEAKFNILKKLNKMNDPIRKQYISYLIGRYNEREGIYFPHDYDPETDSLYDPSSNNHRGYRV